jgi:hypothetical protein
MKDLTTKETCMERKPLSEETKRKISLANKGRKLSAAARKRMSKAKKKLFKEGKLKIPWAGTKGVVTWNKIGPESPCWKGGRYKDKNGYVVLRKRGHPNADKFGSIMEPRFVMAEHLGRPLLPWENVHHVNAIKDDNRIENLLIVTKKVHKGHVTCPHCRKKFAIR